MHITQKIKQIIFGVMLMVGLVSTTLVASPVVQADCDPSIDKCCGGVKTSLIVCEQTGARCVNGADAFEGSEPRTTEEKTAYLEKYGHDYGKCDDIGTLPVNTELQGSGIWGILELTLNILTAGIGIAAVGGIIYGAILYTSAGGSTEQVKKATAVFTNVAIGVIAYALMYALLNFLIPGGLFG